MRSIMVGTTVIRSTRWRSINSRHRRASKRFISTTLRPAKSGWKQALKGAAWWSGPGTRATRRTRANTG